MMRCSLSPPHFVIGAIELDEMTRFFGEGVAADKGEKGNGLVGAGGISRRLLIRGGLFANILTGQENFE